MITLHCLMSRTLFTNIPMSCTPHNIVNVFTNIPIVAFHRSNYLSGILVTAQLPETVNCNNARATPVLCGTTAGTAPHAPILTTGETKSNLTLLVNTFRVIYMIQCHLCYFALYWGNQTPPQAPGYNEQRRPMLLIPVETLRYYERDCTRRTSFIGQFKVDRLQIILVARKYIYLRVATVHQ